MTLMFAHSPLTSEVQCSAHSVKIILEVFAPGNQLPKGFS